MPPEPTGPDAPDPLVKPVQARPPIGGYPSGRNPAVDPPTGGYAAVPPPPRTGQHPAVGPGTGAHVAVTAQGPAEAPSGQGEVDKRFGRFPTVGERFDGYTIFKLLGQGNMGKIYQARDSMNRKVALKVILTDIANDEGLARFQREGEALAAIPRHKNIIQIHSNGTIRGMPYLTMDYVEGQTLEGVLKEQGPLPLKQSGIVIEKLARALQVAHQAGVLHRDLKPANVIIRNDTGEPVLTDFGLAGMRGADSLTQTGDLLGTPLYMSPEQVLGMNKEVDAQADVWGLGVILYEMLTGAVPFPGTSMVEVCNAITGQEPLPVEKLRPEVDPALAAIVHKTLSKQRSDRYKTCGEIYSALKAWRKAKAKGEPLPLPEPPPSKTRKNKMVLAGVAGGMLVLVLGSALLALKLRPDDSRAAAGTGAAAERSEDDPHAERAAEVIKEIKAACLSKREVKANPLLQKHAELLRGRPALEEVWDEVLANAQTRLREASSLSRLEPSFEAMRHLSELCPTPRPTEFAEETLSVIDRRLLQTNTRLGDPLIVPLFEGLSQVGFELSPLRFRRLLEDLLAFNVHSYDRTTYPKLLFRYLVALVRFECDLFTESEMDERTLTIQTEMLVAKPLGPGGDVHQAYLRLLLQLLASRREFGMAAADFRDAQGERKKVLRERVTRHAERYKRVKREFDELLDSNPERLGSRNRANGYLYSNPGEDEWPQAVEKALAADPRLVRATLELAKLTWDSLTPESAKRVDGLLTDALRVLLEDGYDNYVPYQSQCLGLRRYAVRYAALVGDAERAEAIIGETQDLAQRFDLPRDGLRRELERMRDDGSRRRRRVFRGE